ncbi:MAG TPA: ABC transporter substrate-binding protein [Gaiella sp.]|jgi:branched-chain amino acid transport system substrate-binding protein|nr:ABC transporter substrate-binding protein [Gaiella sp.]
MTKKLALTLFALVAALALGATAALAAQDRAGADPGVTSTSVLLGATAPLSGSASAYASVARGADAYFKYVSSRGGVHGRKISYTIVDDGYNPALTVQATRRLVEQDGVFAIFNALGTEHNLAVRDYLNQKKVPQLFAATGATALGSDARKYPYTIGFQPSYQAEGWVLGKYLARTQGAAKVAVLFQNDDYGKDLLNGLKRGMARSKAKVTAAEPYEVTASDVQAQVAKLRASGANVFAIFATPKFAIQAYVYANKLGWKPKLTLNNAVSSASNVMQLASEGGTNRVVNGSVSIVFLKDPTDPKWKNDSAMRLYRSVMKRFAPGANAGDVYHVYGMAAAWTAVEAIRKVGKDLTREGLVKAVAKMNLSSNPFLLPGISLKTGANDHFPIEQMLLQRWQKGSWKSFGGLWGYRSV